MGESSGPGGGQAEIVAAIERFRAAAASDGSTPLAEALARAPAQNQRLLDFVEWKLIEMPLPRLQTIGDESVVEIRLDVLEEEDGPMLEHGLQGFHGGGGDVPRAASLRPRREFLEERYELFRKAS